jgi:nucleoside-diphosphate-sugar epimerase
MHPIRPVDVNGINKMAGEYYHILYNNVYNVRTCVLRLTNTIGPRMRIKDTRQTFVGIWIRKILEDSAFEVWGGNQLRDFNYVDDCVDAMLLAMSSDKTNGMVFNLGGKEVINLKSLAEMLIQVNNSGEYVVRSFPKERRKIDIGDYYSDYKMIQATIGWEPKVALKEGLERTMEFYRENLGHYV